MAVEAGHVQIQEFTKEVIPSINWMLEDVFCRYGVAMPYFLLDFKFPDYSQRPEWVIYTPPDWYLPEWKAYWPTFLNQWPNWMEGTGFNFNLDWGPWGHWLFWFNELLGLLFDTANLPRWQMPDFSPSSIEKLNSFITIIYDAQWKSIEVGDNIAVAESITALMPFYLVGVNDATSVAECVDLLILSFADAFVIDSASLGESVAMLMPFYLTTVNDSTSLSESVTVFVPFYLTSVNDTISLSESVTMLISGEYEFESQTKDGDLQKYGASDSSWATAWSNMLADTPEVDPAPITTISAWLYGHYELDEGLVDEDWDANAARIYLSFDTSSLSGKTVTSATLKVYTYNTGTNFLDDFETDRTLNVYQLNWGTLAAGDWNGGNLSGTFDGANLVLNAYNEITINVAHINTGGETQLELAWKADVDGDTITDPKNLSGGVAGHYYRGGDVIVIYSGDSETNKPTLIVTATG